MANGISSFLTGFALSAALIVAIGAQNFFVLRQGLRREHVGAIVLFCAGADALLIVAGVGGAGAILASVPHLGGALTLLGAAFLGGYGIRALWRATACGAADLADGARLTLGQAIAATAGFTLLNPHVYLDTLLLMGAAGSAQPSGLRPLFVAGAASASFVWFTGLGYGARLVAPIFLRPAAWRRLDALVGVTMLALAASLVLRGVP